MFKKILLSVIVIIVIALLYAVYGRKDLTLSKAYLKEKYSHPNSKFLKWKGGEVHYTETGIGFPILMIHGFGGSNWDFKILDSLLNDKYRVIRVDLPGFGLSDFPTKEGDNTDFQQVYNEYFKFLADTLHLDSMFVIGNSLGGMMAWNLALQQPANVKKMVLFNSAGYDMREALKTANAEIFRKKYVQLLLKKGLPKFMTKKGISRVFYNNSILTETRIKRVNEMWNREGNLKHIISMATSDQFPDEEKIKNISCPTLIIWGKQDVILPVKYADMFARDIKNSQKIIYDSCGHVPMMEKSAEVKRDVLKFLTE